jgi:hypothetical protein
MVRALREFYERLASHVGWAGLFQTRGVGVAVLGMDVMVRPWMRFRYILPWAMAQPCTSCWKCTGEDYLQFTANYCTSRSFEPLGPGHFTARSVGVCCSCLKLRGEHAALSV